MLTNATTAVGTTLRGQDGISTSSGAQKVVIVDGDSDMLELLETLLAAGRYDIVFVESSAQAYSQIKRVRPHLVILCVRIEDLDGFQVLSMLKLDEETRQIPVLTYTMGYDGRQQSQDESPETSDGEILAPQPALQMN